MVASKPAQARLLYAMLSLFLLFTFGHCMLQCISGSTCCDPVREGALILFHTIHPRVELRSFTGQSLYRKIGGHLEVILTLFPPEEIPRTSHTSAALCPPASSGGSRGGKLGAFMLCYRHPMQWGQGDVVDSLYRIVVTCSIDSRTSFLKLSDSHPNGSTRSVVQFEEYFNILHHTRCVSANRRG